ncbi:hypothetical protein NDU88_003672 [Pleurodeles waltl]|uniref:Uncharacterized protein n=1 Tax=Pleurodeles waltl TaxID=8319 RepID=A0AAV7LJJ8_PLEWA|nr:hypothetical protein NDU88_003672 [Pleurodeles waltl]
MLWGRSEFADAVGAERVCGCRGGGVSLRMLWGRSEFADAVGAERRLVLALNAAKCGLQAKFVLVVHAACDTLILAAEMTYYLPCWSYGPGFAAQDGVVTGQGGDHTELVKVPEVCHVHPDVIQAGHSEAVDVYRQRDVFSHSFFLFVASAPPLYCTILACINGVGARAHTDALVFFSGPSGLTCGLGARGPSLGTMTAPGEW